ncbi:MAG: hypothetical protein LBL66_04860 [Clostridiales bacterium]|jgi:hypothetical protein|nr:hypothetical protein [Clostridiales bacterium]
MSEKAKKDAYAEKVAPYLADIQRYASHGVTERQLCEYYGVGRTAWAAYKKRYPELNGALLRAREKLHAELVNRAYETAMGYEYTETKEDVYTDKNGDVTSKKTTTVTRYAKADPGMIQFLLINRFPSDYSRDPQVLKVREETLDLKKRLAENADGEGEI